MLPTVPGQSRSPPDLHYRSVDISQSQSICKFVLLPGSYLNWWQLALVHLGMVIPFLALMWVIPESPRWYIMKGNEWAAEVSLKWLRGREVEMIDREIEKIKKEIAIRKRERNSITMLLEPQVLKPFVISLTMMFFLVKIMIFHLQQLLLIMICNSR